MDTKAFIVELVRSLAWPATALIALAAVRKPAIELLGSLRKFRFGDTEAEFGQGLNEVRPQLPELGHRNGPLAAAREEPPELVVLNAWGTVEVAVKTLARDAGVSGKSFLETLRNLHDKGVLDDKNLDAINGLRALRNLVAHREEPSVSDRKAGEYLAMADAVLMILDQVSRKVRQGQ